MVKNDGKLTDGLKGLIQPFCLATTNLMVE